MKIASSDKYPFTEESYYSESAEDENQDGEKSDSKA